MLKNQWNGRKTRCVLKVTFWRDNVFGFVGQGVQLEESDVTRESLSFASRTRGRGMVYNMAPVAMAAGIWLQYGARCFAYRTRASCLIILGKVLSTVMVSFLDAITCVIGRTVHALDVITSISRYDSKSNLLHFFEIYVTFLNILLGPNIFALLACKFDDHWLFRSYQEICIITHLSLVPNNIDN